MTARPQKLAIVFCYGLLVLSAWAAPAAARLQDIPPASADDPRWLWDGYADLFLAVSINGEVTGLISAFRLSGGSLAAKPDDLRELGIVPPSTSGDADGYIPLQAVDGLSYDYDERRQVVSITLPDAQRLPRQISAGRKRPGSLLEPETGRGAVLNYTLFGATNASLRPFALDETSPVLSGLFEARLFGGYGSLASEFTAVRESDSTTLTRLNSTWSYSDHRRLLTYRAGDLISSSLPWTRPVRLAGFQIGRDYALRPDLITFPIPELAGTAAVPSTVDVYSNSLRAFSSHVGSGPFTITDLPFATGAGAAHLVVRDTLGRERTLEVPFYVAPSLLRRGFVDFSLEAGFPRRSFGLRSNDYDLDPAASATLGYGLTNRLTVEGHAEGNAGLLNGALDSSFLLGRFGVASLGAGGSLASGEFGLQARAAAELAVGRTTLHLASLRSFGEYQDLASVTARSRLGSLASARPLRALEQVSLSLPLPFDTSSVNLAYLRREPIRRDAEHNVAVSYSRTLFRRATVYASAFGSLRDGRTGYGLFGGLYVRLGPRNAVASRLAYSGDRTVLASEVHRSGGHDIGSYGWRLGATHDSASKFYGQARYRSSRGQVASSFNERDGALHVTGEVNGAIVAAGGELFVANRIHDSFAVVDVGAPDVLVTYENRPAGRTNARGRLLLADLRAYQSNRIAIDPETLPLDVVAARTAASVVPKNRSGVTVAFGAAQSHSLLLTLRDAGGAPLPVGSRAYLNGAEKPFIVGYDGQAFLTDLRDRNVVTVQHAGSTCTADVPLPAQEGPHAWADAVCL